MKICEIRGLFGLLFFPFDINGLARSFNGLKCGPEIIKDRGQLKTRYETALKTAVNVAISTGYIKRPKDRDFATFPENGGQYAH